jgi:hypothetical protein
LSNNWEGRKRRGEIPHLVVRISLFNLYKSIFQDIGIWDKMEAIKCRI